MEEVFRPQAMKYSWAPDVYLALTHRSFFRWFSRLTATELAVSRDGEHWTDYRHCKHGWYMPLVGKIEGETVTEALSLYALILRGDEIWVYVEYTHHRCFKREGRAETLCAAAPSAGSVRCAKRRQETGVGGGRIRSFSMARSWSLMPMRATVRSE